MIMSVVAVINTPIYKETRLANSCPAPCYEFTGVSEFTTTYSLMRCRLRRDAAFSALRCFQNSGRG